VGEGKRDLTATDLWAPSPLAEHVPFLGMPKNPAIRKRAGLARTAHNHWILRRLEANIHRRSRSQKELRDWVEGLVENYIRAGSATAWKDATKAAWSIGRSAADQLDGADPGGQVAPTRPR
jgi:hypothetical protein